MRRRLRPLVHRQAPAASMLRRVALGAVVVGLLLPATASAADRIHWASESGFVGVGNLDGSGAGSTLTNASSESGPCGVAIDPAADKIYWANFSSGAIRVGNLDGTGTASTLFGSEAGACGVAINPAANKIYWASYSNNTIRVANLDGTGTASTLFGSEAGPSGVAIDPAANKIYWTNQTGTTGVRVGNLDGSGTASTLFGSEANPIGVAIDPAAGKIYWADLGSCCSGPGTIRVANLDGSGTASTLFGSEPAPAGVAIDPAANKIYWANFGSGAIRVANLDGSGTAANLFTGQGFANFPVLLRAPAGTGPPTVSGEAETGEQLNCGQGDWASNLLGGFLFRAPRSFQYQWLEDGGEIGGETAATFTPTEPGPYACRVTASNQAGSSSQTSDDVTVPAPETQIDSGSSGLANDPTPTFAFSSPYTGASFECKVDSGSYAACASPKTTSQLTDGPHTFSVRAKDSFGNVDPTPASRAFTVDTAPPNTTIDSGPSGTINDPTPTFTFSSPDAGATFECKVDSGSYSACGSPKTTAQLADGSHTFRVRAKDAAGNFDAPPAVRKFTVDTTPPETTIDSGPRGTINDPTPTFTFSSPDAGATFECKVDSGSYSACSSPVTTAHLTDGSHVLSVRATDPVGNTDATPATRTLTLGTASVSVSGTALVISAAPGAKDNLEITRPTVLTLRVTDFPSGAYTGSGVHTGAGCTRSGDYTADCPLAGITPVLPVLVTSAGQADQVVNSSGAPSSLYGGPGDDTLKGGTSSDILKGGAGADVMRGMDGNDLLLASDLASDTTIDCDGGTASGNDKADLDLLPKDSAVTNCETKTRH